MAARELTESEKEVMDAYGNEAELARLKAEAEAAIAKLNRAMGPRNYGGYVLYMP